MKKHLLASAALLALLGGSALAADMPITKAPPPLGPGCDWNGFYFGGNVGGSIGWNKTSDSISVFPAGVAFAGVFPGVLNPISNNASTRSPAGGIGGFQFGYNWNVSRFLLGAEVDFNWTGQRDTSTTTGFLASTIAAAGAIYSYTDEQKLRWLHTVRARLG